VSVLVHERRKEHEITKMTKIKIVVVVVSHLHLQQNHAISTRSPAASALLSIVVHGGGHGFSIVDRVRGGL
jgi:hypothetical protein